MSQGLLPILVAVLDQGRHWRLVLMADKRKQQTTHNGGRVIATIAIFGWEPGR